MSTASLTKLGILDVVRKMLKMFIFVFCTESLCTSVFGGTPFSLATGQGSAASLPPLFQLPGRLLLQPASCMAAPLRHIVARPVSTKATPQNLWSSWAQVSGPFPFGQALPCFHACVVSPLLQGACSGGCEPWVLGPRQ